MLIDHFLKTGVERSRMIPQLQTDIYIQYFRPYGGFFILKRTPLPLLDGVTAAGFPGGRFGVSGTPPLEA